MPDTTYQPGDLIIFQHIAKTAGSTLRWSLASRFHPREVLRCYPAIGCDIERDIMPRSDAWKRRIRLFATNRGFGTHTIFPQRATYLTLLREPDTRALSQYYYQQSLGLNMPEFDIYLDRMLNSANLIDSFQVRCLSDARAIPHIDEADLDRAKHNLQTYFSGIGFVEEFKTSLTLFASIYGWSTIPLVNRNVSNRRPPLETLTTEQRERLHAANALDHELYAFARPLYEKLIADHQITPDLVDRTIQQGPTVRLGLTLNRVIHNLYRRLARLT